jgi:hypothetical protein
MSIKGMLLAVLMAFVQPTALAEVLLDGKPVLDLQTALQGAKDGSRIDLGPGVYHEAGVISVDGLTLIAGSGAVLADTAAESKAALVIKGDNTRIEGLECRGIKVPDRNGACIRLEGSNLELDGVYFHDSQQGLLTGPDPGRVLVSNSRFERLGHSGRAHGIYMGGGELYIYKSEIIASKDEGHEVKSRASHTQIERSLIANIDSEDSRLIDIPNGGVLIIEDSVLQQGPASANNDMIGYGLEGIRHKDNRIRLHRNVFILDSPKVRILHRQPESTWLRSELNTQVGKAAEGIDGIALELKGREELGLPPYPSLEGLRVYEGADEP